VRVHLCETCGDVVFVASAEVDEDGDDLERRRREHRREHARVERLAAADEPRPSPSGAPYRGLPASELSEQDLLRELERLHLTRNETFLHGSTQALVAHSRRQGELEEEYLRRHPERDIDPERLRWGARHRER
jgi:hypothetical protein